MTVGTRERLRLQNSKVEVVMDGYSLTESQDKVETLLGCQIEPGLKWHKQVDDRLKKLQKRLTGLTNLRSIIPFNIRKRITEGMFMSVLVYCLPVFGGCDQYELEAIQVMQNQAARLVTHLPVRTPRKEIFSTTGWMTVNQLICYHSALSTFRIRQSKEPKYLNNIMSRDNRSDRIIIPITDLTLAKKSYCFRAAEQWNRIPEFIRKMPKIGQFKFHLKKWILRSIEQFV